MDITSIDKEILMFIQTNIRCNFLTPIMKAITYLGNSGLIWIIITLLLLMFKKTRKIGILSAIALIEDLLICNVFLKQIIKRMRPYDRYSDLTRIIAKQPDYSFPSGHSAAAFASAMVIFKNGDKKMGIPALALAILISASRLYVGVHYPSDVIGGIIIGMVCSYLAEFTLKGIQKLFNKKTEDKEVSKEGEE